MAVETRRACDISTVLMASEPGTPGPDASLRLLRGLLAELRPLFAAGRAFRLRADTLPGGCVNLAVEGAGDAGVREAVPAGPDFAERLLPGEPVVVASCMN